MAFFKLLTTDRGRNLFLPAHGRGAALPDELRALLNKRAGIWDLPELPDLGGPLVSKGAIAESQKKSAYFFGAQKCWYGVNGATGLLQAALLALARPGEGVLMPRNVHRSILHACFLGQLKPVLFDLPFKTDRGHVWPPDELWLKDVLNSLSEIQLVISAAVLVHPTYQGYANNLNPLVQQLHQRGLPVLVDEAHGAHFVTEVDEKLPVSALKAGADLVVHSLHKSATGLAQTAVLWLQGNKVDHVAVERSICCLQTTSPSSLLIASCETSLREWSSSLGKRKLKDRIDEARELRRELIESGLPVLENQDPLRLILHTAGLGISGLEADSWFISQGLVAELPEPGCLTFCLGFAPHSDLSKVFRSLWDKMITCVRIREEKFKFSAPPVPLVTTPKNDSSLAWIAPSKLIPIPEAAGRVSAELICPYPPGIPLIIPGEELDKKRVDWLAEQQPLWPEQLSSCLRVVS